MDLSLYPQSVPDSVFPLEECELLNMSNLEDVPNSRQEESNVLTLEDIDELTDFGQIASPSSLDPGSPCILTTLQNMSYLTDQELRTLPVRDLNKRIRNLPFCEVQKIRRRRRSLKNRGYAYNCRKKRQIHKETLEEEKETLSKELDQVTSKLEQTRNERDMYKEKYERLQHLWNTYCNAAALMTVRGGGPGKSSE